MTQSLLYKTIKPKYFSNCWLPSKDGTSPDKLCNTWEEYFDATRGGVTNTELDKGAYIHNERNEALLGADGEVIEQLESSEILLQSVDSNSVLFSGELAEIGRRFSILWDAVERIAGVPIEEIAEGVSPKVNLNDAQVANIIEQIGAFTSPTPVVAPKPTPVKKPKS